MKEFNVSLNLDEIIAIKSIVNTFLQLSDTDNIEPRLKKAILDINVKMKHLLKLYVDSESGVNTRLKALN